jgi:3-dehydroquinate dehydratase-2
VREPDIYGKNTYKELVKMIKDHCKAKGVSCELYQSNHEGDIVTKIQKAYKKFDGIVINPAAYTHTSVAILDALKAVGIRTVEVHISDVSAREDFRQISYVGKYAEKTVAGLGFDGYIAAIDHLIGEDR